METTEFRYYLTDDPMVIGGFTIVFFVMMFIWAYGVTLTKKIMANTYQINFIMGLIIQFTGVLSYPYTTNTANFKQIIMAILLTGIPITICQTIYIAALRMSKNTGMVSIMGFISVAVSYFISIFRYREVPNLVTSVGVVLVLFGLWRAIFGKSNN